MYETLTVNLSGRGTRFERLDGRDHLVSPTVLIVEGVLEGSAGPLKYAAVDIQQSAQLWHDKPLLLGHPTGGQSAAAVLDTQKLGVVRNVTWQAPRLLGESWLDIQRVNQLAPKVLQELSAGRQVEVSTGLWTVNVAQPGTWNGKPYTHCATKFQPDHLAILPDQIGACSVACGCGLGVQNSSQLKDPIMNDLAELNQVRNERIEQIMRNPRSAFSRQQLESFPLNVLNSLVEFGNPPLPAPIASYYGQQGVHTMNCECKPEPPLHSPTLNGAFENPSDRTQRELQQNSRQEASNHQAATPTWGGLPTLDGCFKNPLANR